MTWLLQRLSGWNVVLTHFYQMQAQWGSPLWRLRDLGRQVPFSSLQFLPESSQNHSFYRRARISGLWDKILEDLVKRSRKNAGRKETPSYAIIDSQSVKTVAASEERGIDGGKKQKAENVTS